MNFERRNTAPLKSLDIGLRAVKKAQIQNLIYKEKFFNNGDICMGVEEIINLIIEKKDVEYLEIFKEDFLVYFAIPVRKGEKWRWEKLYETLPQFPSKGVFRAHELINEIVSAFANIK